MFFISGIARLSVRTRSLALIAQICNFQTMHRLPSLTQKMSKHIQL